MRNILFICGKARKRSPSAAAIVADKFGVQTDFAGISADSDECVSSEKLDWADTVAVMEKAHLARLKRQMSASLKGKKLVCLDILDDFEFMQQELIELVVKRIARVLR